ncbi:MAG: hypothetical protein IPL01_19825 [Acidobacteria bacterium]|nr:hypothetical protein [Acidobacteriota bacterium]
MSKQISRREFVASSLTAGATIAMTSRGSSQAAQSPAKKIVLAVAGVRTGSPGGSGRGPELINKFSAARRRVQICD